MFYKKYKRYIKITDTIDNTLATITIGLGAGEIGLLSTIIATPIIVGMESGAVVI